MDPHVKEPPAAYSLPPRVLPRHTWEEYAAWPGEWELIRGVPYSMSPAPFISHNRAGARLLRLLCSALDNQPQWGVIYEMDWIVDAHTTIRPDVMVAREPLGIDWLRHPPHLVMEILSPSTAAKDRIEKRAICEEQRVQYFVLVDPDTHQVEAFVLGDTGYQSVDLSSGLLTLNLDGVAIELELARIWT
jgi:Uma2 family endonuclease